MYEINLNKLFRNIIQFSYSINYILDSLLLKLFI